MYIYLFFGMLFFGKEYLFNYFMSLKFDVGCVVVEQVFLLYFFINIRNGDVLVGELEVICFKQNYRLMDVKVVYNLEWWDSFLVQLIIF